VPNGAIHIHVSNGAIHIHVPNGAIHIHVPNGAFKIISCICINIALTLSLVFDVLLEACTQGNKFGFF